LEDLEDWRTKRKKFSTSAPFAGRTSAPFAGPKGENLQNKNKKKIY
jgi:hypothetical protein